MIKKIFFFSAATLILPIIATAHVKWFAEAVEPVRPYSIGDLPVIIAILSVIVFILLGIFLEKKLAIPKWFLVFMEKYAPHALSLASIGFGFSFILFSYNGFVFAPNLISDNTTLLYIQAIAGIMILLGLYERIGGLLILVLFALCVHEYGFIEMMDTFEMLGFALYAIIIGRPRWKITDEHSISRLTHKFHMYGLPLLRVGTGINLIILGFSEKILAPSLTANFLSEYHWNFMYNIGFHGFSDYWFAFAAGTSEALFGIFFLLGLITRTTTLALAVFLVTTLILLGPTELMGHLPHFSLAIILVVLGAGARLKLVHR